MSLWSATDDKKIYICIKSFQNFQSINIAKSISWFTESQMLKDIKFQNTFQLRLPVLGQKKYLFKIAQRLYFLTKYVSLTRHSTSLSLLHFIS